MSPQCVCCGEHIHKLNQQVSVMRKEIKNLRYVDNMAPSGHHCAVSKCNNAFTVHIALMSVFFFFIVIACILFRIAADVAFLLHVMCLRSVPFSNRQMLDSAIRAHRKHMVSIQSAVSKIGVWEPGRPDQTPSPPSPELSLDKGRCHFYSYVVTHRLNTFITSYSINLRHCCR